MRATAVVHKDSSNDPIGMLTFTQQNADGPVIIRGTLVGFNPNSVHVSSLKKLVK
jgi:hypothetical protein